MEWSGAWALQPDHAALGKLLSLCASVSPLWDGRRAGHTAARMCGPSVCGHPSVAICPFPPVERRVGTRRRLGPRPLAPFPLNCPRLRGCCTGEGAGVQEGQRVVHSHPVGQQGQTSSPRSLWPAVILGSPSS